jgi:hypothetical protein
MFELHSDINISGQNNIINATIDTSSNRQMTVKGKVTNITSETLKAVGYDFPVFKHAHIEGDIIFHATLMSLYNVDHVDFTFTHLKGEINKSDYFDASIALHEAALHGHCQNNCSIIEIDKFAVRANDLDFSSSFNIQNVFGNRTITGEFKINSIPVQHIKDFWPLPMASGSRKWIFNNITHGTLHDAAGKFSFDLNAIQSKKPSQTNFLQIDLALEAVTLKYMDSVPPIHDIDAQLSILNDDLKFSVSKAKIANTEIINAEGTIKNLSADKFDLQVTTQLKGSAQDVVDLGFAHAEIAQHPYHNLEGSATTSVEVALPIQEEDLTIDDIYVLVDSTIQEFAGEKLYKDFSFSQGELKAQFRNRVINISGKALFNNSLPVNLTFIQDTTNDNREIKMKSRFNWKDADKLGFHKPAFISNFANMEMSVMEEKGAVKQRINLDLTSSAISLKNLGIMKKTGEPGTVKLTIDNSNTKTEITDYYMKIGALESGGQATVSHDFSEIYSLTSNFTKIGASEFNVSLKNTDNQTHIHLYGNSLDLSSVSPAGNDSNDFATNILLSTKLNKIILKDGATLQNPEFELECSARRCPRVKLAGNYENGGKVRLEFNYPNVAITSDDAGKTIRAFGISQKIDAGTLDIHAKYNDNILNGVMKIDSFRLRKAPLLAKILSITSLTVAAFDSLGNIAGQQGIGFDKAYCPFSYNGSIIKMKKCEALGSSLVISGSGTINIEKGVISINGTIAAPNIIDSVLGKIPLIGKAITGSDDKGFIGANFTVAGTTDDPEVRANPLSILTPGILRQIFNFGNKQE